MRKPNWGKSACGLFLLCATTAIALCAQTLTPPYSFAGSPTEGAGPNAALVRATDGNF